jgi:hypothetical protein
MMEACLPAALYDQQEQQQQQQQHQVSPKGGLEIRNLAAMSH